MPAQLTLCDFRLSRSGRRVSGKITRVAKGKITARLDDDGALVCTVTTAGGLLLTLRGSAATVEPERDEEVPLLGENPALVHNAWAYAKHLHAANNLLEPSERKEALKTAERFRDAGEWIAELVENLRRERRTAWCSGCLEFAEHTTVASSIVSSVFVCTLCGSPGSTCAAPSCEAMAVRRNAKPMPRYCAEHRHDVTGFETVHHKIASLDDWEVTRTYAQPNLRRRSQIAGAAAAAIPVAATAALFAAPAVGGAVGSLVGSYSGAAATNYGLALLGGGAIAKGGLGMAGGTAVVTALGGALGGGVSASVANAYAREDKSFRIEKLRDGDGPMVLVCSGFLNEGSEGWGDWEDIVNSRYPMSPVYRVHWGSKELRDLGVLVGAGGAKVAGGIAAKKAAAKAAKLTSKRLGPAGPVFAAAGLAKNPWHVAKSRADKTGIIIADLLARTETSSYILIGHSLGARAMTVAAQTLHTNEHAPHIEAVHLLGAAIGANSKQGWDSLAEAADEGVYNYFSRNDSVLKFLYRAAQGLKSAAGEQGFEFPPEKLTNVDVTDQVAGHSDYCKNVKLR